MSQLTQIQQALESASFTITVQTITNGEELVLPSGGIQLEKVESDLSSTLPSELSDLLDQHFLNYSTNLLELNDAYLQEVSTFTPPPTDQNATPATTLNLKLAWKSASWDLIPNLLTLSNPEIKAHITPNGETTTTTVYCSGILTLGKIPLAVSVILPDMTVTGAISGAVPADGYSLTPLLSTFGFQDSLLSSVMLDSLQFSAAGRSHIFSFDIGLGTDFSYTLPGATLSLTEVGIDVQYTGGTPSDINVTVNGQATLNGATYSISICHDTTDGWSVSGSASFDPSVTLTDTLNYFLSQFNLGTKVSLPAGFTGVCIGQVSFSYDQSSESFDFTLDLSDSTSVNRLTSGAVKSTSGSMNCTSLQFQSTKEDSGRSNQIILNVDESIPFADLPDIGGDLPAPLNTVTLDDLVITINLDTTDSDYTFQCTFADPQETSSTFTFVGCYSTQTQGQTTTSSFGGNIFSLQGAGLTLTPDVPLDISIQDLFIARVKVTSTDSSVKTGTFIFYGSEISIQAELDLSDLPLVGPFLQDASLDFQGLRFVYAKSKPITVGEATPEHLSSTNLRLVNDFLQKLQVPPLTTSNDSVANSSDSQATYPIGFSLQGVLNIGNGAEVIPLHAPLGPSSTAKNPDDTTKAVNPQSSTSPSNPSPVGQKFGPVTIKSVSLGLKEVKTDSGTTESEVALTFSGGITLGPLTLDFINFTFETPVTSFDPNIELKGLGLDINKPPLTLQGMFMEEQVSLPVDTSTGVEAVQVTGYTGSLSINYNKYSLDAIGSYLDMPNGDVSTFLYGFVGAPLGGPPFFFVTGAAAGFGYNRAFTLPAPTAVNTYPLIQPAANPSAAPDFNAMNLDFLPVAGDFWGTAGIRGSSFKMVTTFILLDVQFQNSGEIEIDIIGLSNMVFPKPKDDSSDTPALAKINIGVVARILPQQGVVAINGAFQPGSYVYNPAVHISGGFAALSIFKQQLIGQWAGAEAGDFVVTLGGYANNYKPKSFYPEVARMAMTWQYSSALSVKALAYFALTPQAMMAGGHLIANFQEGGCFSIHVNFQVGADFIIYWKPYHYSANFWASLDVTASISIDLWLFTIHASISLDLGADLNIWGPEFSGNGTVYIHVLVSFSASVSFGAGATTIQAIGTTEFQNTLMPDPADWISKKITAGLVSNESSNGNKVVNPKDLEMEFGLRFPMMPDWVQINGKALDTANYIQMGSTITLPTPSIGAGGTWSLSDTSLAKLIGTSQLQGLAPGELTMTYTLSSNRASYTFIIGEKIGIKPMNVVTDDLASSTLNVITTVPAGASTDDIQIDLIYENVPAAIWEPTSKLNSNGDPGDKNMIHNVVTGLHITTAPALVGKEETATVPQFQPIIMPPSAQAIAFAYETFTLNPKFT